MKKKTPVSKIYSFYSVSSPHDFIERAKAQAFNSNLKIEQVESGFDLQIDSGHSGRIVYRANVSADEKGGSLICGEMVTIPWSSKPEKKKNIFQKILSIFVYTFVMLFVLIFMLCYGIYSFFVRLFGGKINEITNEDILYDFMVNEMRCQQKEE